MDRRRFLESLILGASALAIDPERLLWTPGAKTIFIPPAPVVVRLVYDCWIRQADGRIRVETRNYETDDVVYWRFWPGPRMPLVHIPSFREPALISFGPYPTEDAGTRLTALMFGDNLGAPLD